MIIDRIMVYNDDNYPIAAFAVGLDNVSKITNDGDTFTVFDENDEKLCDIFNFYQVQVNYLKGGE